MARVSVGAESRMFSAADAYERFMGRWSRKLAPRLVRFAGIGEQADEAILDVGCGTGALTLAVAAHAPATRIVGVDRSSPYVEFARAHFTGDRIRFEEGDALALPFPEASFDRTLSLLILNFVADPRKALAEMRRVTRPGGTVAAAVWDYGEGMEMLRRFWDEVLALDPTSEARDERHMPLSRSGELAELWQQQGLQQVASEALTIETHFTSFDDYWAPFLEKQGPAGAYVALMEAGDRAALRTRLRERLAGGSDDRAIRLTARAWAVRGVV